MSYSICIQCQGYGYIQKEYILCPLCKGEMIISKNKIAKILSLSK